MVILYTYKHISEMKEEVPIFDRIVRSEYEFFNRVGGWIMEYVIQNIKIVNCAEIPENSAIELSINCKNINNAPINPLFCMIEQVVGPFYVIHKNSDENVSLVTFDIYFFKDTSRGIIYTPVFNPDLIICKP